jgi:hypothetical protein
MIETREYSGLAKKLVAGLISNVLREGAIVFDFLQGTQASLESGILCEVNRAHPALADPLAYLIAAAQYLPVLERWEQCFSFRVSDRSVSA